jgi:hypothetical protein
MAFYSEDWVTAVAFSPDGAVIARPDRTVLGCHNGSPSADADGTPRLSDRRGVFVRRCRHRVASGDRTVRSLVHVIIIIRIVAL